MFSLTIFGASGDLAKLKIFPAIYGLAKQKQLPSTFYIFGYARSPMSDKAFRKEFEKSIIEKYKTVDKKILNSILKNVYYHSGQYDNLEDFKEFQKRQKEIIKNSKIPLISYLSVPPSVFQPIIENIGLTKAKTDDTRLVIEKPFGENTKTANSLFHFIAQYFSEDQIYLLDHYLGKNSVQSILNLREKNRILNNMLKGSEISNIQITAFEDFGVKERIGYFDQVGIILDMFQSHLLQVLALVTMSIPSSDSAESLKQEKENVLSALKFTKSENNIVIGQYDGYTKEKNAPKNSQTPTFAAFRFFIDRQEWFQVPIYIRTGKKMHQTLGQIVIELKKFPFQDKKDPPNRIIFEIKPSERFSITLTNSIGHKKIHQDITTSSALSCQDNDCLSEHAHLLMDVLEKNQKHFLSFNEILATWKVTDQIEDFIKNKKIKLIKYKDNSPGPKPHLDLPAKDEFNWYSNGN